MSFLYYGTYRDSDTEWLGMVPTHWTVSPLKRHARLITERTERRTRAIALEHIESWSGRLLASAVETEFEGEGVRFEPGDVLYGKLRPYLAKVLSTDFSGEAVGDFHVIRPMNSLQCHFLSYALRTKEIVSALNGSTYGAKMPRVGWEFMGSMVLAIPPRPEQAAIVAFLDRETGKIDALVEEQKRLIDLLKEKRQAVISQSVTRGLNPDVSMKDSGVEWLGEVPAHWEVKRLKHLGFFNAGAGFPHEEQGAEGEELSFHKVNALSQADSNGWLTASENTVSRDTANRLRAFVFPAQTIVFAKIGAALLLGRIRRLREEACLDNNMMGFVVDGDHDIDFVTYVMSRVRFDLIANPGTVPSLNESQIANVVVAMPEIQEQREIVTYLADFVQRNDALVREAETTITLLQERRAALISAAVTGKIDVRGLVTDDAQAPTATPIRETVDA